MKMDPSYTVLGKVSEMHINLRLTVCCAVDFGNGCCIDNVDLGGRHCILYVSFIDF